MRGWDTHHKAGLEKRKTKKRKERKLLKCTTDGARRILMGEDGGRRWVVEVTSRSRWRPARESKISGQPRATANMYYLRRGLRPKKEPNECVYDYN
jgi:hypothetical protein